MTKHLVKCVICGQTFDANVEPYLKPSERRYAHKKCYDDKRELDKYIEKIFEKTSQKKRVEAQVKRYQERGISALDILYALSYWFDVKKNPVVPQYGIGIVPHIYEEAREYYDRIKEVNNTNRDKKYQQQTETMSIFPQEATRKETYLFFEGESSNDKI